MYRPEFVDELFELFLETEVRSEKNPLHEGFYSSEYKTMWLIEQAGGTMLPSQIATALGVTTPRVTVILNNMENNGLVERTLCAEDRRKINVKLTKKGRKTLESSIDETKEWLSQIVEKVGMADSEAAFRFLKAFNDTVNGE